MLFGLVQPFLYNLDIVVAEVPPEQIVNLVPGLTDLVVLQQLGGLLGGLDRKSVV